MHNSAFVRILIFTAGIHYVYSLQMIQIKSCLRYNLLFWVPIDVQICFFTDSSEIYLLFIPVQLILKSKTDWHPISTLNHTIAFICISLVILRKYLLYHSLFKNKYVHIQTYLSVKYAINLYFPDSKWWMRKFQGELIICKRSLNDN